MQFTVNNLIFEQPDTHADYQYKVNKYSIEHIEYYQAVADTLHMC